MARIGVTYADVKRAAELIVSQQGNPTVDTVREALGDTGSKSTIAPLLKRWRQQVEPVSQVESALPVHLLQSVRNLYEEMQANQQQAIAVFEAQAQQEIANSKQLQIEAEQDRDNLSLQLQQTGKQLEQALQLLADREEELRQAKLAATRLETEHSGLQLRLNDHVIENQQLHKQLQQVSQQFEHYQSATAQQRQQERMQADQRQQMLEQELSELRRQQLARQEQLLVLENAQQQLNKQLEQTEAALQLKSSQNEQTQQQLQDLQLSYQEFKQTSQLQQLAAGQAASQAQQELELSNQHQRELQKLIDSLRDQIIDLVQERKAWNQERKDLLQMLERFQQQHLLKDSKTEVSSTE